jgi:hypothetical protein
MHWEAQLMHPKYLKRSPEIEFHHLMALDYVYFVCCGIPDDSSLSEKSSLGLKLAILRASEMEC